MSMTRREFTKWTLYGTVASMASPGALFAKDARSGLSMTWAEWGNLDAIGMAQLLAAKQVTPAEVAAQAAKAVELLNPKLNAVVEVFDDVVANPFQDGMNQYGPFHGVPMFIKDSGSTMRGRLRESAMAFMKGNRAEKDSPLVRNFRRAGLGRLKMADKATLSCPELGPG